MNIKNKSNAEVFDEYHQVVGALPDCQNKFDEIKASLEVLLFQIDKTIQRFEQSRPKGREYSAFEIFCKADNLGNSVSSSIDFLSQLKRKIDEKNLILLNAEINILKNSVVFYNTLLEEKNIISLSIQGQIERSLSAVDFTDLGEKKEDLKKEILEISEYITEKRENFCGNEKELSKILQLRKKFSESLNDVVETLEKYKKIDKDFNNLCKIYPHGLKREGMIQLIDEFISRTFSNDAQSLEKWVIFGKKAVVIHREQREEDEFLFSYCPKCVWKEWTEDDEKMIKWFLSTGNTPSIFLKDFGSHKEIFYRRGFRFEMTISS